MAATERPINLRDWQVRAALDGRLSQIWVPMKPQPELWQTNEGPRWVWRLPNGTYHDVENDAFGKVAAACSLGCVGDRLWIRETFSVPGAVPRSDDPVLPGMRVSYRADASITIGSFESAWRPSSQMPRWASRLTLEILSVGVAQVQSATEDDARACGILPPDGAKACPCQSDDDDPGPHIAACPWRDVDYDPIGVPELDEFAIRWNEQHGKRCPWAENSWAWKLGVRRVDA